MHYSYTIIKLIIYLFYLMESCNKLEPFQNSRELVFLLTDNLEFSRKITKV
jgi:hypothetical protein